MKSLPVDQIGAVLPALAVADGMSSQIPSWRRQQALFTRLCPNRHRAFPLDPTVWQVAVAIWLGDRVGSWDGQREAVSRYVGSRILAS